MRAPNVIAAALLAGVVAVACAKGESEQAPAANDARQTGAPAGETQAANAAPTPPSPVPLATRPSDACGWIPAADVEAMIGKLAAPPQPRGRGCLYALPIPPEVAAMRERLAENNRKIGAPERPWQDTPYGVMLQVDVGVATGERGVRLMGGAMAQMVKDNDPARTGWDAVRLNGGRLGTISVTAAALTADVRVPRDTLRALNIRLYSISSSLKAHPESVHLTVATVRWMSR